MTFEEYAVYVQHLADQIPENELNQLQGTVSIDTTIGKYTVSIDMTIEEYAEYVSSLMKQAEKNGFTYE